MYKYKKYINLLLFPGSQRQKKGEELAGLAEQRIIISGVGLVVESHGEEGKSAGSFYFILFSK